MAKNICIEDLKQKEEFALLGRILTDLESDNTIECIIQETLCQYTDNKIKSKLISNLKSVVRIEFFIKIALKEFANLSDNQQEQLAKDIITVLDTEYTNQETINSLFRQADKVFAHIVNPHGGSIITKLAQVSFSHNNDPRYKLFASYGWIYSSQDQSRLKEAVSELEKLRKSSDFLPDLHNYIYMIVLALHRICLLKDMVLQKFLILTQFHISIILVLYLMTTTHTMRIVSGLLSYK